MEMDDWARYAVDIPVSAYTWRVLFAHTVQAWRLAKSKSNMNPAYLLALAALSGSAVGGLTSFFSSWLGQSAQLRAQVFLQEKGRRQELYRDFVDEASRLYIDAL